MLGTVGVPNILLAILIALPFIDLRRERRLSRRPVAIVAAIIVVLAMGTLTYKGATAKEALGSELKQSVPHWAAGAGLRGQSRKRSQGRRSSPRSAAPTVTPTSAPAPRTSARPTSPTSARATEARTSSRATSPTRPQYGNNVMPPFAGLGEENLAKLGAFLDASKGPKG